MYVLSRYGIENYFTQNAMEAVLGRDLTSAFPLDETRPVGVQIGGYRKEQNVAVIKHMQPQDFARTDIEDILSRLKQHVVRMLIKQEGASPYDFVPGQVDLSEHGLG